MSFTSQFFQLVASVFGVKKHIEKSIVKNKFDQEAAPLPKSLKENYEVSEKTIMERSIWTLGPKGNTSEKVIVYLHGGAYLWNISKYNWSFAGELLSRTNATLIVPDYPLAPEASSTEVYEFMDQLYQEITSKYSPENIVFIGESAGGGLALGFTMHLRDQHQPQPCQLILLAPWLDVTMNNPEILEVDKNDKILGIKGLQMAGEIYRGQVAKEDFKVSPIYGDLSDLPEISIFVGTYDLFVADSRKLKDKALSLGIPFNYYEYPKMFHIWILDKSLKEATVAKEQIVSLINEEKEVVQPIDSHPTQ